MLGNLTVKEIESRSGVTFPDELLEYMADKHQSSAANIEKGKWHCFDIPFVLMVGDIDTAQEIYKYLSPLSSQFKEPLQIALSN
jgi:hypothetical protein